MKENCHGITVATITYPKEICECNTCEQVSTDDVTFPVALNRSYELCSNIDLAIHFQTLFHGDYPIQSINLVSSNMVEHGILSAITSDFTMVFSPETDYIGAVDFDFCITDMNGHTSNIARVTIQINACEIPCNETTVEIFFVDSCTEIVLSPLVYPLDVYSPFSVLSGSGGKLGEAINYTALLALLNTDTYKPIGITFLPNVDTNKVNVFGDCNFNTNIKTDNTVKNTILYLPDHHSHGGSGQIIVTEASSNTNLGIIKMLPSVDYPLANKYGDILKIGNFIYVITWGSRTLIKIDISNPLSPVVIGKLSAIITGGGGLTPLGELATDNNFIYYTDNTSNEVVKIDLATFTIDTVLNLTALIPNATLGSNYADGFNLYACAFNGNGKTVVKIDTGTMALVASLVLPNNQLCFSICGDENYVYVMGMNGTIGNAVIYKIEKATFTVIAFYDFGRTSYTQCLNITAYFGKLFITFGDATNAEVQVVDATLLINIAQITTPVLYHIDLTGTQLPYKLVAISPCYAYIPCDDRYVLKVDLKTKAIVGKVCTGGDAYNIAFVNNVDLSLTPNLDALINSVGSCVSF